LGGGQKNIVGGGNKKELSIMGKIRRVEFVHLYARDKGVKPGRSP